MKFLITTILFALAATTAAAQVSVKIGFFTHERTSPPTLSNIDAAPDDLGLQGARLGLADNAKTGRFLQHDYALIEATAAPEDDAVAAATALLAETRLLVVDAPAATLLAIADAPEAAEALIFNAAAEEDALRAAQCRANILHAAPSFAMRADALMQFLVKKRWTRWALIMGRGPGDMDFAAALRRSSEKFRAELVGEREWAFDADMRRNAAQEVPLFTQDFPAHDVLIVVDEIHDFGRYVLFNAWEPRPVAGSEGLTPVAWAPVVEQWGAAQLQSRFEKQAERPMRSRDYGAWAAMRAIGEAVTRTQSAEAETLRAFLLSDQFELAGFKGRPLTFRDWNGQLRQPIPLVHPRALAALAPMEGFLHQRNELDTLGLDAPESGCAAFGRN